MDNITIKSYLMAKLMNIEKHLYDLDCNDKIEHILDLTEELKDLITKLK